MQSQTDPLQNLQEIRRLMDRNSRFLSLSGLSGVAAGVCALVGAHFANQRLQSGRMSYESGERDPFFAHLEMYADLLYIAAGTFVAALVLAFLFTWLRSRRNGVPIWGRTARRVMWAVAVPMVAGGGVVLRLIDESAYGLIAPVMLLFYGLALINASKFTLTEIGYLGYGQLILGGIGLLLPGTGLYLWAAGFGVLHIVYGILMWNRYERKEERA